MTREVYMQAFAYVCELGDHAARCLGAGLPDGGPRARPDLTELPELEAIGGKQRKQLSRSALLAIAAARRCLAGATETRTSSPEAPDRSRLPLFVACPTGVEIAVPFLSAAREHDGNVAAAVFGQGGGNVVDYLKYSTGTIPGHVAKYGGARGMNACFSGRGASFFALRKATMLLRAGRIRHALVVGAESHVEAARAGASRSAESAPQELGCALLLSSEPATRARSAAPSPRIFVDEHRDVAGVDGRFRSFEAVNELADLLWALESPDLDAGCRFFRRAPLGRERIYGLLR